RNPLSRCWRAPALSARYPPAPATPQPWSAPPATPYCHSCACSSHVIVWPLPDLHRLIPPPAWQAEPHGTTGPLRLEAALYLVPRLNATGRIYLLDAVGPHRDSTTRSGFWRHLCQQRREQPCNGGVASAGRACDLRLKAGNKQLALCPDVIAQE